MSAQAYIPLTKRLTELDLRGTPVPSELVLTGPKAFPLVMNSRGQVLMAASYYGQGRIVVLGHESYMTTFPGLVENAVTWLGGEQTPKLSVGVSKALDMVADNIRNPCIQVRVVNSFREDPGVGTYITDAYSVDADANELVAFVKAGRGVLIAGQALDWAAQNPNESIFLGFPGNKVCGVAGIHFTANQGERENLPIFPQIPTSFNTLDVGINFEKDLEFLLDGTSQFDLQGSGTVSEVLAHGPLAFSIGATDEGRAFLAGGYYGRGRVISMGHEPFLSHESMSSFWHKAIHWLNQGRSGVVGFMPGLELVSHEGLLSENTKFKKDLSVFVCTADVDQPVEDLQEFVAEGGGLLIGGQALDWGSTHPHQNVMTDYPGNKILNRMGLSVLTEPIPAGLHKASSQAGSESAHFRRRLRRFVGNVTDGDTLNSQEEKHLKRLGRDCMPYLNMKDYDSFPYTQAQSYLTDILKWGIPQVSEETPVSSPKDHLLLSLVKPVYNNSQNPDALLPYLIKNNPPMPVAYNQRINTATSTSDHEGWISTGLYLPPGMQTYMLMPKDIIDKKWRVQIGCQTDVLKDDNLKRAPSVCENFPVTSEVMLVWNVWGGLIYLVAPPETMAEGSEVIVEKAVSAPYYNSGTMTASDWLRVRDAPAPWAELEFDALVLTLPSHFIRNLDNIDEVTSLWNKIMKDFSELYVVPGKFPRKERIVADVQISPGLTHDRYPMTMISSEVAGLVKLEGAKPDGLTVVAQNRGVSELRSSFKFPQFSIESQSSLWSVYTHEEKLGVDKAEVFSQLTPENRQKNIDKYIREGRKLSNWQGWIAVETYLQLQEKFGWNTFKKVSSEYQGSSNISTDNPAMMNQFAEKFSLSAGMDLTEFFMAWGWPIEKATMCKLNHLPLWSDYPMPKVK